MLETVGKPRSFQIHDGGLKKKATYWCREDSALCAPETKIPISQSEGVFFFFFFMGNQLTFNCDILKLYKVLTFVLPPHI